MPGTIAIVEDEANIVELIKYNLDREGYRTISANNGRKGLDLIKQELPDLVILDLMLPELDGISVCKQLRSDAQTKSIPIIILTAKSEEADRVLGLEMGADDYVVKPFSMRELLARVKSVLKRTTIERKATESRILAFGDLVIDLMGHEVTVSGGTVDLSSKEFDLLRMLATHPGQVLTREQLVNLVWGNDFYGDSRTVDVHIRWLREKIETDPGEPKYILTIRGVGYKFRK